MTTVAATVTPGQTFTEDANNRVLVTKDRLNNLGQPTVNVPLDGQVAAADLAAAVADMIPNIGLTVGAEASDAIEVTLQVKDAGGSSLSANYLIRVWLGDASMGGLTATAPNTDLTVTTGTELEEITSKKQINLITDANGTAVVKVDNAAGATDTWYLMAELDGKVFASGAITITV